MATIANLNVKLNLDDSGFRRGLQNTRDKLDGWGSSLRSAGTKMTAAVTTPIVGAGLVLTKWASDLEQTHGATEQLWGENADAIFTWAEGADRAMGMTENSALQNANRFNAMFKQMDAGNDTIMDMSKEFTQLSADLSAMWGGSPDEAADRLTSALRGNYEGLDQYNINLTEAMVNTEAMKIAVADGRDEISEADKVQALYNLIMEQSGDAQGQFARETDTTAGKMAIATARAKNAATAFGKLLLPYVNKLLDGFSTMVGWLEKLDDKQRMWVIGIAAAAAAIGPLLLVIGMLLPGLSALLAVIGFLVSPIGLVVVAVGLLAYVFRDELMTALKYVIEFIGNLVDAWQMLGDGMSPVEKVLRTIQLALAMIGGEDTPGFIAALARAFGELASAFSSGGWMGLLREFGNQILTGLQNLAPLAWQGIQALAQAFWDALPGIMSAGGSMIQGLWDGAVEKWPAFSSWLAGLAVDAATWVGDMAPVLLLKGIELVQGLWDGAVAMWPSVQSWLLAVGGKILEAIGDMLPVLLQKGTDLLQGFWQGVLDKWPAVSLWFVNLGMMIVAAVGALVSTLKQKGTDIIGGFYEAVTTRWVAVRTWFINMPTMIFNAIGAVLSTLKQKGTDLLTGLYMAVIDKWSIGGVRDWFSGLGGKIVSAVGSLGSSLYDAGVAVMNGLWDGLKAGWGNVTSWLSGLNPADWKGPEERDKKMLYMPGIWIMQGLQHGLSEGWDDVTRQLSSYTPSINGGLDAAHANRNGGTIVNHNYFVTPEALKEMIEGGKFAREFAGELNMSEGVA